MNKTKIALGLVALLGVSSVMAEGTPNPLMRPATQQAARGGTPSAPPSPSDMGFMMGPNGAMGGAQGDLGKNDKTDERIKAAQNSMIRYNVVAVNGDMAVLRVTAAASGAAAVTGQNNTQANTLGGGNSSNSAAGGSPGGLGTGGVGDQVYGVLPSLMVKNGQKLVIQDVEVNVAVHEGQVTLRTADGKRAIYTGRLEGNSGRSFRGFIWAPTDSAYTARQSPPVSKNATASAQSTTPSGSSSNGGTGFGTQTGNLN